MFIIHFRLSVLVATDAREVLILPDRRVALRATRPLVSMLPGVNPEVLLIVVVG